MTKAIKLIISIFILSIFAYTNAESPIITSFKIVKTYDTKGDFEKMEGFTCQSATDGCNTFSMKNGEVFAGTRMYCNTPQIWSCKKEIPKLCTMEYAPVCSVTGKTYSNKCVAGANEISYIGECRENFMTKEKQEAYKAIKNRVSIKTQDKINTLLKKVTIKVSTLDKETQEIAYSKLIKKIEKVEINRNNKIGQLKYYTIQYIIYELDIIKNNIK